ncbi:MAG: C10 family peptidase [Candidatus Azobacteroides sp.]|nr:C10 family peptidase [Candidatus Azobacteroides sp.]
MKNLKLVLIVTICFFPLWLWAKQVNPETAQRVAEMQVQSNNRLRSAQELNLVFIKTSATDSKTSSAMNKASSNASANVLYYVFNMGESGFVIVSGDDIAVPVLGYSDTGAYDPNNLSPEFVYYLDDCLAKEIEQAIAQGIPQCENAKEQWDSFLNENTNTLRASNTVCVAPLVLTKWNQSSPYNALCPSGSVTGCVATALAQIMKYWNCPATRDLTIPTYTTTTNRWTIPEIGSRDYNWANMTYTYSSSSLPQENNAVAALMYDVGAGVKMDYDRNGSGAPVSNVTPALVNYFKYDSGISCLYRDYYSNKDWTNRIRSELDAKRPVFYVGYSSSSGHAFVCDGYDSDNLFHFNWGWGGSSDGYFELSALNPNSLGIGGGSGGYNTNQSIVVGIQPNTGGSESSDFGLGLSDIYPYPNSPLVLSSAPYSFSITIENLYNISSAILYTLNLSLQLCNDDGTYITDLQPQNFGNIEGGLNSGWGWSIFSPISGFSLPSGLLPGMTYRLYATFSPTAAPFTPIRIKGENGNKYIRVTVADNGTITLTKESETPDLLLETLLPVGNIYANRTGRFVATITNNGDGDYNSTMTLQLNNTTIATDPVVIPAGTTKEVGFSGTIGNLSSDTYSLVLWYDPNNNQGTPSVQLGSSQVTVQPAPPASNLSVTSFSFPNANAVSANEPNLSISVKNSGGIFDGNIGAFIFNTNGGTSLSNIGIQSVTVENGEEKTIIFNNSPSLPAGNYGCAIFSIEGNSGSYSQKSNLYTFTLTDIATWTPKSSSSDWNNPDNWIPDKIGIPGGIMKVIIPKSASYPILTAPTTIAEIHFEPDAQIGHQSFLTDQTKAFVQYDFSNRESWNMLSIPLKQVYPGDFTFGGYPQTQVQTFTTSTEGNLTKGSWVTIPNTDNLGNSFKFGAGDGFIIWLNRDDNPNYPIDATKGLKLLGNNIRELPFFRHHDPNSPDYDLYGKIHQAYDYSSIDGKSMFYNVVGNGANPEQYVRGADSYEAKRDESAYRLAGTEVSKTLDFAGGYFALAGNPYMATLDFSELYDNNGDVINNVYHVWTDAGYESYSCAEGPFGVMGAQSEYIAPLQGFIVEKSVTASSGELLFKENMATVVPDIKLRSSVNNENKLNIDAHNPIADVRAIIAKREGGQDEFGNMDALKIINNVSNVPEIYTLKPYQSGLIATGVNIINDDDLLIPIGLATSYAGEIKLSFSGMDSYNVKISFIDTETDKSIDLTGLTSYDYVVNYTPKTENGETAVCEDRFFIRISNIITNLTETVAEKVNVYEANGRIQVVSGVSNPIKEVAVYTLQGVLLYKESSINTISYSVNRDLPVGAYIVKVISEKNVDNVKLLIK